MTSPKSKKKRLAAHNPAGVLPDRVEAPACDSQAPDALPTTHPDAQLPAHVHLIAYDLNGFEEFDSPSAEQIIAARTQHRIAWVHVDGVEDLERIKQLGRLFALHPLTTEDIAHVHQRAKVERYDNYYFIVLRSACRDEKAGEVVTEQISICFGQGWVLTFEERHDEVRTFETVREFIRTGRGRIRQGGADALCHALLDATIDDYIPLVLEHADRIDALEERVILNKPTDHDLLQEIYNLKREVLAIKRSLLPLRDDVNILVREESPLLSPETRIYLRDCQDHVIRTLDQVESHRELCTSLMDLHLSTVSHRMNEVMKVLTIISTIFIPLSFVVGLYGMNFNTEHPYNMPELNSPYGYPAVIGFMLLMVISLLTFFYRRGWIGSRDFRKLR
jgi:magnesium transporter